MSTGPRLPVQGPARTPLPFGLYATTQTVDDPDPHWGNGTTFQPDACDESATTQDPCPAPAPDPKEPTTDGLPSRCADAITVYSWIECGPIGLWGDDGEEFRERSMAALLNGEARAIEREFWTGDGGLMPHLAEDTETDDGACVLQTAATELVTGGVAISRAIGEVEHFIAECCGNVGVIHIPWKLIAVGFDKYQFVVRAGKLYTQAGTPVVASGAYPGTSPAGAAPAANTAWIYGTGPVMVRRGAAKITDPKGSLDKATNSMVMIAERTYSITWDGCHVAALVAL